MGHAVSKVKSMRRARVVCALLKHAAHVQRPSAHLLKLSVQLLKPSGHLLKPSAHLLKLSAKPLKLSAQLLKNAYIPDEALCPRADGLCALAEGR